MVGSKTVEANVSLMILVDITCPVPVRVFLENWCILVMVGCISANYSMSLFFKRSVLMPLITPSHECFCVGKISLKVTYIPFICSTAFNGCRCTSDLRVICSLSSFALINMMTGLLFRPWTIYVGHSRDCMAILKRTEVPNITSKYQNVCMFYVKI